jgi:hypothetical protein
VLNHLLLIAAVLALAHAGLRGAAALGAQGLQVPIGAAVLAATAAGVTSLGWGLAGLGGSAWILALSAAGLAAAATWRLPPAPRQRLPSGALAGAALGAAGAWLAWLVKDPALAIDPLSYHLPESIMWVQQGTPGSVELLSYEFPQGNYPVTNELLVSWLTTIGRSLAPALAWTPLMGALLVASAYALLPRHRGLAAASVLLVPVAATQFLGPHTDLPAVAWLAAAAALQPLPLALLAAALAVGTKTTVAPLAILVLLVKWRRPLAWRPLAAAAVAGAVVGGTWYLRNWIDHGSPLWPFVGGDIPEYLARFDNSFLGDPADTLRGRSGVYVDLLAGGLILLVAAILAPLADRRRAVLVAAGAAVLAALAWGNAPFTGLPDDDLLANLSLTTTRYLLPAIAAAAAAVAMTRSRAAGIVLAAAALFSLERSLALEFPGIPSLALLVLGAVAGALLLPLARRVPLPVTALAAAVALTIAADGLGRRHGGVGRLGSSGVVSWMTAQKAFTEGDEPVAFAPQMLAVLAGDGLEHEIEMIPPDEPCAATLARRGWLVVGTFPNAEQRTPFNAAGCLRDRRPVYSDIYFRVYRQLR